MKVANGIEIIKVLEQAFPKYLSYAKDPIGLHIGTLNKKVKRIMVTLDVLENVVDEAIAKEVDLIVAHHPLLFRPIQAIDTAIPQGRLIEKAICHQIAIYGIHTNLDIGTGGINDYMANSLGLSNCEIMDVTYEEPLIKLVTFVPKSHIEAVYEAICHAGAGHIGNYKGTSFQTEGIGMFIPLKGAAPFIGKVGHAEQVSEIRLETILPLKLQNKVLKALLVAHPYEEVAYDFYPLNQKGKAYGLGRVGCLAAPMSLHAFANWLKEKWDLDGVRVIGDLNQPIQKVAVSGGDGNKYIAKAKRMGADVFVSGDIYYHNAHSAMEMGLSIVDVGHHAEKICKPLLADFFCQKAQEYKWMLDGLQSESNTNPFRFL